MASSKRRILVIDDQDAIHQDYRKIICPTLSQENAMDDLEAEMFGSTSNDTPEWDLYEIDSAYQGRDAVELVEKSIQEGRPYAVAFVDVRMPPGLDGVETVREIWQLDPEILIVFCSAHNDYSWQDLVSQLGRTDRFLILKKPFDNVEVRQCAAALSERWVVARTDALTGILNRRAFEEHLRREWAYSLRHDRPLACVMLDLDLFKAVNDEYGHLAGDTALQSIAKTLRENVPDGAAVCRYGGEEMCVLMPSGTEGAAAEWAEAFRKRIASEVIWADDRKIQLTVSCGVAQLGASTVRQQDLIQHADSALCAAKRAGRNRVYRWTDLSEPDEPSEKIERYAARLDGLKASEIMATEVNAIEQTATVGEAATRFLRREVSAAPVVNEQGELVGLLSEQDIAEALGAEGGWSSSVASVMMPRVIHYDPDTDADQIFRFLCRVQLQLVIITDRMRPVGAISCNSFLRWFCESYDEPDQSLCETPVIIA